MPMRYLCCFLVVTIAGESFGQIDCISKYRQLSEDHAIYERDFSAELDIQEYTSGTKLYALSAGSAYFHRTYLMDQEGEILSDGFMASPYFLPNDNLIVFSAQSNMVKDSFNPYGASDMASMLILGTFNNFISRIMQSRKKRFAPQHVK